MGTDPMNPRRLGRLYALSQVGMEMVAPIGLGVFLDLKLGWLPWATVTGAILGLVGGMAHLLHLLKIYQKADENEPTREPK